MRASRTNIEGMPTFNGRVEENEPAMKTQKGLVRKVEDHRECRVKKNPRKGNIIGPAVEGLQRSGNVIQRLKNIS